MQTSNRRLPSLSKHGLFVILLATAGYVACYNPDIKEGSLTCALAPKKACPDDFYCNTTLNKCVLGSGAGTGGVPGQGGVIGAGGVTGTGGIVGAGGTPGMCVGPLPGCKASNVAGTCDPACQAGCGCNQICSLANAQLTCLPDTKGTKSVLQACGGDGPKALFDDCKPGNICLEEWAPDICGKHCFRYCKDDTDCAGGAHCTVQLEVSKQALQVKVCDNPPETCAPVFGTAQCTNGTDRPSPAFGCYIMGGGYPDQAVCDCAGTKKEDELCEFERECKPGLVCIDPLGGKMNRCKRICPLRATETASVICGLTKSCVALTGSQRWGFCK
jgi:hypothetical protein